jgi:hypothetical protein
MRSEHFARFFPIILPLLLLAPHLTAQKQKQTSAQSQSQSSTPKTLVINGQTAPNAVLQLNGRAYADILAFAQLTGATIKVLPDRIILNMPGTNAAAEQQPPQQPNAPRPDQLSREFARQAIAFLATVREWRNAVETLVSVGAPESRQVSVWLDQHRNRAEEALRLTGVAASTPADRNALQLLQAEFSFMRQWDANAAAARQNLDASYSVDPDSIQNDPLLAKINNCDNFLSDMLSSGTFSDSGVCR